MKFRRFYLRQMLKVKVVWGLVFIARKMRKLAE